MSDTPFEVAVVKAVVPHPNADRLEIVKVLGTQFVTVKDKFQADDLCVYFPPDMLISEDTAEKLGVANYLKHSVYPGDLQKSRCRIGAIRLRGTASFGFGITVEEAEQGANEEILWDLAEGDDLTDHFGGEKYQPDEKFHSGDSQRQPGAFHIYTSIQHYYRHEGAIPAGAQVRITEKIHGTNSRVGLVKDDGFEFMCGTHRQRKKYEDKEGRYSLYWNPLTNDMKEMLEFISRGEDDVIVFGEIYGNKIQQMDYACARGKGFRVFDISVNGEYLDWDDVQLYCGMFGIEPVNILYSGAFSPELIDKYVSGPTTMAHPDEIKCKFKGREGIVITPLEEQFSDSIGGRLILKAVSSDYYEAMK
jgi:RNA ligase (TIGR02306 family)